MSPNRFSVLDALVEADEALSRAMHALQAVDDEVRPAGERLSPLVQGAEQVRAELDQARRAIRSLVAAARVCLPAEAA